MKSKVSAETEEIKELKLENLAMKNAIRRYRNFIDNFARDKHKFQDYKARMRHADHHLLN